MKYETAILALTASLATAREVGPLHTASNMVTKREVPQEHCHEAILRKTNTFLKLDNPLEIQDAVFSLLGNKAAAEGAPNVKNLDCLQQIVADQAFTNAKAAGDVDGQANAIMFRALERNTGSVGLASVICNETAVNPEIAAITQHQDPASPEAAGNKAIALEVAKQLASIGADPTLAIQTGTFAPGTIGDPTGAGNTCDDPDDAIGCIISQNLLVPDVTEEEIQAAVAGVGAGAGAGNDAGNNAGNAGNDAGNNAGAGECVIAPPAEAAPPADVAPPADAAPVQDTPPANDGNNNNNAGGATGTTNVQTFTGALGGPPPPVESTAGAARPFSVDGSTFLNIGAALQRSCSVQHNKCSNAANAKTISGGTAQCETQQKDCEAAAKATKRSFPVFRSSSQGMRRQAGAATGACGSPAIKFAVGLDGRKEASFQAVNQKDFNHGSALNIKVISDFVCQQLESRCKAAAATVSKCKAASAAAQGVKGKASADAFNAALGV